MSRDRISRVILDDVVDTFYYDGADDQPLLKLDFDYNTFTGFRIAPE